MQKQTSSGTSPRAEPDPGTGEFDELLSEIEKEPVPARLLDLAQKLHAALVERRKHQDGQDRSDTETRQV